MLPSCAGTMNTHETERVMSEGGCQEVQNAHDLKRATEKGVKTQGIMISASESSK